MVSNLRDVVFQIVGIRLLESARDSIVHSVASRAGRARIQDLPDERVGEAEPIAFGEHEALNFTMLQGFKKLLLIRIANREEQ